MKKILTLFLFILINSVLFAQAPQGINYQGVARDNMGNAILKAPLAVQFRILQGTTPVYIEAHSTSTDTFGLYTLVIGTGSPTLGTFSSIPWGSGVYSIAVYIDGSGGTAYQLIATSQLQSVPYALYSGGSATGVTSITTNPANITSSGTSTVSLDLATVTTATTVGSSSVIPQITVDQYGRVTGVTPQTFTTSAGTVTSLTLGAGLSTPGVITSTGTIDLPTMGLGGSVGSATAIPVITYDTYGRIVTATTQTFTTSGGTVTSITGGTGIDGGTITSVGTFSLAPSGVTANTYGDSISYPIITVDNMGRVTSASTQTVSSGNVVVTSAPTMTNSVSGNTVTISALNADPIWNANQLQSTPVSTVAATNGQILQYNGTEWTPFTPLVPGIVWLTGGNNATAGDYIGTNNPQPFILKTNNAEAMRIDPNGKVGIGTINPQSPLQVIGKTTTDSLKVNVGAATGKVLTSDGLGNASWQAPSGGGVTSVTTTAPLTGTLSAGAINVGIPKANAGSDGYLSSTDWNTFNGKGNGTVTSVTAGTGLAGGTFTNTGTISMPNVITPGTYGSSSIIPQITVDAQGRVTGVTNQTFTAGSVTSVSTNTTLTGGPISATGTLSLATIGTATTVGSSSAIPVITTDIYGRVTSVSAQTFTAGSVTSVTAGTGLAGGTFTNTGSISMPNVGTAGTYGSVTVYPIITTDAQGRVSSVTTQTHTAGTVTSIVGAGPGLSGTVTATGNITANNNLALWNADKLQGTGISVTTPTTGQVLQYNGTSWTPFTTPAGVNAINATAPLSSSGGSTPTLSLNVSGVTAGSYGSSNVVPTYIVDVFGRITNAANMAITGLLPAGANNQMLYFSGGWTPSILTNLSFNGTNMGIGNVSPIAMLDVVSTTTVPAVKGVNTGAGGAGTTNTAGYFSASGAANNYAGIFDQGNVGIGTITPGALLDIGPSNVALSFRATNTDTTSGTAGYFNNTSATNASTVLQVSNAGTADALIVKTSGTGMGIFSSNTSTSGGSGLFKITSAGNNSNALSANTNGGGFAGSFSGGKGLQTDKIQITNGASPDAVLTSTNLGGDAIWAQPIYFAANSSSTSAVSGSLTPVVFSQIEYNNGGAYNNTTGKFTAPVEGVYHFDAGVALNSIGNYDFQLQITKNNGTAKASYLRMTLTNSVSDNTISADLRLMSGDVVQIAVFQTSGSGNLIMASPGYVFFTGHKIR